jgi:cell division protein FtsQ
MKNFLEKYDLLRIIRVLGAAGLIVVLYFSIQFKANSNLKKISITIETQYKEKLIDKSDVLRFLNKSLNKDLEIAKIEKVDISKIEKLLDNSNYIKNADVYLDSKNQLHIHCELRDPIVRINRTNKKDYYLDIEGNPIPVSQRATIRVPLITGATNRINLKNKSKKNSEYRKILKLSKKIHEDPFLNALIEQIDIDEDNSLTLIPKLGKQQIEFGDLTNIDNKLTKIKAFYKNEMKQSGWNKFKKLSVKWDGQIVGSF